MTFRIPALAVLGMAFATSTLADDVAFKPFALEFEGKLSAGAVSDVNFDGRTDLSVVLANGGPSSKRQFVTCLQDENGFAREHCSALEIPDEARVFDVGEIDGVPGAEFVLLTDKGITWSSFADGRFGPFTQGHEIQTLFAGTEAGKIVRLRFLWRLDADEVKELVLPTIVGPRILRASDGELRLVAQIESHAQVSYRLGDPNDEGVTGSSRAQALSTEARFAAPQAFVEDFNGDARVDVVTLQGNRMRVFLQRADGNIDSSPSFEWDRSILDDEEQDDHIASEGMTLADLNGDGISDVIAMKWGTPSERTQIDWHIYYARAPLQYPDQPDQKIRTETVDRRLMVADLNADGKSDLAVPFFHFAVTQAVKVVTQNAVKFQFRLFLMGEDGRYGQGDDKSFARVDRRIGLNYDIDILGFVFGDKALPGDGFSPLFSFNADANGDGYPDLVADTGSNRLRFYWGNEDADYASFPDLVIDHESSLNFDLADLNADGKTDVVTYHGPRERQHDRKIRKRRRGAVQRAKPKPEPEVKPRGPVVKILLSQ